MTSYTVLLLIMLMIQVCGIGGLESSAPANYVKLFMAIKAPDLNAGYDSVAWLHSPFGEFLV